MKPREVKKLLESPLVKGSIVRTNLIERPNYTPYCGNPRCLTRTYYKGDQFHCRVCKWVSEYPKDFIKLYQTRWGIKVPK